MHAHTQHQTHTHTHIHIHTHIHYINCWLLVHRNVCLSLLLVFMTDPLFFLFVYQTPLSNLGTRIISIFINIYNTCSSHIPRHILVEHPYMHVHTQHQTHIHTHYINWLLVHKNVCLSLLLVFMTDPLLFLFVYQTPPSLPTSMPIVATRI